MQVTSTEVARAVSLHAIRQGLYWSNPQAIKAHIGGRLAIVTAHLTGSEQFLTAEFVADDDTRLEWLNAADEEVQRQIDDVNWQRA